MHSLPHHAGKKKEKKNHLFASEGLLCLWPLYPIRWLSLWGAAQSRTCPTQPPPPRAPFPKRTGRWRSALLCVKCSVYKQNVNVAASGRERTEGICGLPVVVACHVRAQWYYPWMPSMPYLTVGTLSHKQTSSSYIIKISKHYSIL